MERVSAAIGPLQTNVHLLADPATREAIAIDCAIPCVDWISGALAERGWTLKLIVSTHGHWDHTGDNAALAELLIGELYHRIRMYRYQVSAHANRPQKAFAEHQRIVEAGRCSDDQWISPVAPQGGLDLTEIGDHRIEARHRQLWRRLQQLQN